MQGHEPGVGAELGLWLANSMWIPAVLLVLVALPLLFPTGRPPTPRWRIVGWAAVAGGVLLFVGTAFLAGPLENYDWVDNPLGVAWMPDFVSWVGFALWWATTIAAVVSIVVRFRRSHGTERAAAEVVHRRRVAARARPSWRLVLALVGHRRERGLGADRAAACSASPSRWRSRSCATGSTTSTSSSTARSSTAR